METFVHDIYMAFIHQTLNRSTHEHKYKMCTVWSLKTYWSMQKKCHLLDRCSDFGDHTDWAAAWWNNVEYWVSQHCDAVGPLRRQKNVFCCSWCCCQSKKNNHLPLQLRLYTISLLIQIMYSHITLIIGRFHSYARYKMLTLLEDGRHIYSCARYSSIHTLSLLHATQKLGKLGL